MSKGEPENIRLNFLPLDKQVFSFPLWRKEYNNEKRSDIHDEARKYWLPIDDDPNEGKYYWILFLHKEGFDEYICKQNYNLDLTQYFLYLQLKIKLLEVMEEERDFFTYESFRKIVFFIIKDHEKGRETLSFEPYFLKEVGKYGFLIDFKFKSRKNQIFDREIQRLSLSLDSNYRSNKNFYTDKYQKISLFHKSIKDKIFPITCGSEEISPMDDLQDLNILSLSTKKYIFNDNHESISQFRGIEEYGPFELISEKVEVVFLFRKSDYHFAKDLANAIRGKLNIPFSGIGKTFRLDIPDRFRRIEIDDFSDLNLKTAVENIKNIRDEASGHTVITVFINDKEDDDTYFKAKGLFLHNSLPIQVVTTQKLREKDFLKWSTSNISLAMFSKIGGKPWIVKPSNEKCIIFGIGQAHEKDADGKITKYFAYSICTDSSGLYKKMNILGNTSDSEKYYNSLKNNVIQTIKQYKDQDYEKYVIHVPFKIRKRELREIQNAIEEFHRKENERNIDLLVLRINTSHKFFGYAYNNSMVPFESSYVRLDYKTYLIWLEGLQYHRATIYKRVSGPVLVEFLWHNKATLSEDEKKAYLQDVINLSGANWRGFNSKNQPISIYYCELIAKFVSKFKETFEIDSIENPWFL